MVYQQVLVVVACGFLLSLATGQEDKPGVITHSSKVLKIQDTTELQSSDEALSSSLKLKFAIAITRDSARTPLGDKYIDRSQVWTHCHFSLEGPKLQLHDPDGNPVPDKTQRKEGARHHGSLPGGCPQGMISNVGYSQAVAYGTWLRQRYLQRFKLAEGVQKEADAVSPRSSYHNRTLITLQGVLQGLLPSAAGGSVRALVSKEGHEVLYGNGNVCKALGVLIKAADVKTKRPDDDLLEGERGDAEAVLTLMKVPDQDGTRWVSWKKLLDATMCLEAHNMTLFPGLQDWMYELMDREATKRIVSVVGPRCNATGDCQKVLQLSVGRLLALLDGKLKEAASCGGAGAACKAPLHVFSGHDRTLLPLLAALGHPVEQWPPFMSNLVLELWQDPSQAAQGLAACHVRVLYNFKPLALDLNKPHDSAMVPWSQFEALLKPYTVGAEEYQKLCDHDFSETGWFRRRAASLRRRTI